MYISSHGLKEPSISDINPICLDNVPCFTKTYDFCSVHDIDFNLLSRDEKLFIIQSIKDLSLKEKLLKLISN